MDANASQNLSCSGKRAGATGLINKVKKSNIFVLSQEYKREQKGLNMITSTDSNFPNHISFIKWGAEGQSWKDDDLKQFEGLIGAVFGPDEDTILNPIFAQLPLFKF